jgi:transposase-like protein
VHNLTDNDHDHDNDLDGDDDDYSDEDDDDDLDNHLLDGSSSLGMHSGNMSSGEGDKQGQTRRKGMKLTSLPDDLREVVINLHRHQQLSANQILECLPIRFQSYSIRSIARLIKVWEEKSYFRLKKRGGNTKNTPEEERDRKEKVKRLLKEQPHLSLAKIGDLLGIKYHTVCRVVKKIKDDEEGHNSYHHNGKKEEYESSEEEEEETDAERKKRKKNKRNKKKHKQDKEEEDGAEDKQDNVKETDKEKEQNKV